MATALERCNEAWPVDGLEHLRQCPVCGDTHRHEEMNNLEDTAFRAAPGKWTLHRCAQCRTAYLDPRPNRSSIALAYRNYYTHDGAPAQPSSLGQRLRRSLANGYRNRLFGSRLRPAFPLAALIAPLFRATAARIRLEARGLERLPVRNGRILDVGCGDGSLIELVSHMGWQCFGVEFDNVAAAAARSRGIEIAAAEVGARYHEFFDAVTLSHVIEHVHDPLATLRQCLCVMKPGAYLWLQTPNIDSAGYEIYGRSWRGLEPPRHLTLFNPDSLRAVLHRAGFDRIRMLDPEDVTQHLFTLSAMLQAGRTAGVDVQPLDPESRRQLEAAIRHARVIARDNPERSEFIGVVAFRPDADDRAQQ